MYCPTHVPSLPFLRCGSTPVCEANNNRATMFTWVFRVSKIIRIIMHFVGTGAAGTLKMRDRKMRDLRIRHQTARVENAGTENAGPTCKGGKCGTGKCRTNMQGWALQDRKMWEKALHVKPSITYVSCKRQRTFHTVFCLLRPSRQLPVPVITLRSDSSV